MSTRVGPAPTGVDILAIFRKWVCNIANKSIERVYYLGYVCDRRYNILADTVRICLEGATSDLHGRYVHHPAIID